MKTDDLFQLRQDLTQRGEPFALATVVWRRAPSSAQPGNQAIVTLDGKMRGWLSGACAQSVVVREARKALESGEPQIVLLGSPDELAARANDGISLVKMTCQSEGAIELFVEPVLPKPHLVIIGRTPMVGTLVTLATTLGWRVVVVDDKGDVANHPGVEHVVTTLDLAAAGVTEASYIVVATQGQYDELAVDKALETNAAYIGLVASRKRAKSVMEWCKDVGYPPEVLARVKAPAGLDLGHLRHDEIAVGLLAELVQHHAAHRAEALRAPSAAAAAAQAQLPVVEPALAAGVAPAPAQSVAPAPAEPAAGGEAIDPICEMTVDIATARFASDYEGQAYYFCCPACKKKFETDPPAYLPVSA
ncbi:MAG: XdhC family protein [Actinomycetota bacterium]